MEKCILANFECPLNTGCPDAYASFDPGSMHNALMAAYLQCTEVHQMLLGTLEKIAEDRGV